MTIDEFRNLKKLNYKVPYFHLSFVININVKRKAVNDNFIQKNSLVWRFPILQ